MVGGSTIKHWSSTQMCISLSTGESELYAANRAISEALGLRSSAKDFGEDYWVVLHVDASATYGLVHRQGLGRNRHIEVQELWLQERIGRKDIMVRKIRGT